MTLLNSTLRFVLFVFAFYSLPNLQAGSWQNGQAIGGFSQVDVYTPDNQSPVGDGRSLLLILHGCVQPINNFQNANLEQAAEQMGMVIAVPDAANKAGFSCWSYWQGSINRNSGDYQNLINLVSHLLNDNSYNIDSNQVYIAGLSSGASFAMQTACLAPDIFAGVAPSAGPSIGTSSSGAINSCEVVAPTTFKQRCESYAGTARSFLDSQIAVIGQGTADTTVDLCYNQQNANGFAEVYGVSQLPGTTTITESPGKTADQIIWQDNRVAMLWFNNLTHEWSGGSGAFGSYIGDASINFAIFLGSYFAEHNLRVNRNTAPSIDTLSADVNQNRLVIQGTASDVESQVDNVHISIELLSTGEPNLVEEINTQVDSSNRFNIQTQVHGDGLYQISAFAIDNESLDGETKTIIQRIGPEPPATAPQLSNTSVAINAQCAIVSGSAYDVNLNLDRVEVSFSNGTINAQITGNNYQAQSCDLPGGINTASITAIDSSGMTSTDSIAFEIDAGVVGDYNLHIALGHITWGDGYASCYLAFGASQFIMRETSAGNSQCEWVADTAPQCNGPVQSCQSTTPPGEPPNEPPTVSCEDFTSINYTHKLAGRAYSQGNIFAPDYFAQGSDEPMFNSTYGTTTLHSDDAGVTWRVGICP